MKASSDYRQQQGVALIISLILLVVMTLLGISVIRSVTTEERMAGNSYNRNVSFQAVDAALRTIEIQIEAIKPTPTAGCALVSSLMVCAPPASGTTPRWLDSSFTSWQNGSEIGNGSLAITPQYFVEYLGATFACNPGSPSDPNNCKRYRVTAKSPSSDGRSPVMLQSIYATD